MIRTHAWCGQSFYSRLCFSVSDILAEISDMALRRLKKTSSAVGIRGPDHHSCNRRPLAIVKSADQNLSWDEQNQRFGTTGARF